MDELVKSFPAAEGMIDAEQGGAANQRNENCLNCGTKLQDTFCHHCGQKDIPKRQTLGELWTNFISSFWSYEGKFFRTTKFLITKPGFLAVEYNAGKRESYYHPARMYVFISFVFFLLFSIVSDLDSVEEMKLDAQDIKEIQEDHPTVNIDSLFKKIPVLPSDTSARLVPRALMDSINQLGNKKKTGINLTSAEYATIAEYDSAQRALTEEKRDGWLKKKLTYRNIELNQRYKNKGSDFGNEFVQAFLDNFSKVLFFLLPVFALLLKLLYVRKDYFYSEHLVFSIYYYNFFYLAGSLLMLINQYEHIALMDWLGNGIGLWIFVYLLFAMKRMYNQSWKKTSLKFFLFAFLFLICLWLGVVVSALFLLMLI